MRVAAALAVCVASSVALGACKDKQQAPAPKSGAPSASKPPAPAPSLPETKPEPAAPTEAKPGQPISIAEATAILPKLTGPTIIALKQTSDQQQVHGTWCLDGTSADDVAKQVGHTLAQSSFTGLTIRGDARKAGVMGDRDGMRFSMVVSASSAAVCAAPAHYFASATIFKL